MYTVVVKNEEEDKLAFKVAEAKGLKLGCCSNTGLPEGSWRLTFLPDSAFKQPGELKNVSDK